MCHASPAQMSRGCRRMKVLVGCEFSGIVRDAFLMAGHEAVSCDLLPTESPGPHIQGNILDHLDDGWDLGIFHPPCTYLSNSGVRWLHSDPKRWELMADAAHFFNTILSANIPSICVENPIQHKYARALIPLYQQIIHPWQYGHPESKTTCLWLKNLHPLVTTRIMEEREQRLWKLPPSLTRWKKRSVTYAGIAQAMAEQWSKYA